MLLRRIGRKDFAKFIWELAGSYVDSPIQGNLFQDGYEQFLAGSFSRSQQAKVSTNLQSAIMKAGVADDEEIANCLARIVTDIAKKPYFRVSGLHASEEWEHGAGRRGGTIFRAILRTICQGTNAKGIAFLIDEFEEIGTAKAIDEKKPPTTTWPL